METNINFQYPVWFILFCLLAGLGYALILYFRDQTFRERSSKLNWPLGILRFLLVSFIAMLLLSPFLKSFVRETKKPIIVLAQDNSESILAEMSKEDSLSYTTAIQSLGNSLSKNYELKQLTFGSEVRESSDLTFDDKESNLSEVLDLVGDLYTNQNLGAVILASDGIYNQGSNPLYSGAKMNVPVYTIALGDTTAKKDLMLKKIYHNRIAYLGDRFSIQIDIGARNCAGNRSVLSVYKIENGSSRKLQQEPVEISGNDFFTTKELILDADQSGVQRYRIALTKVSGEVITANNVKDIFIDVLDARQKILILANAPHPDLAALKQTITRNKNYEAEIDYISSPKQDIRSFDLVIFHQLPSTRYPINALVRQLNTLKTPRLFILGSQTNLQASSQDQSLISIQGDGQNTDNVEALLDESFSLFTLSDELKQQIPRFTPLVAPFGNYSASGDANILFKQKIGSVETNYPLLAFGEENGAKVAVLAAEGIWKWRIFDFLQNKNHDIFEELFGKTIQYLTVKEDKRKFRVNTSKNLFKENEPILFDGQLYNDSYEQINDVDVSLIISDSEGKDYNFTFSKTDKAYTLNAGYFPVGNYNYRAKTIRSGKELFYAGKFSVQPIQLEIFETTANHQLLRMVSERFGGEMIYPGDLATIPALIEASGNAEPVFYTTTKTRSMINLKWIFFLFLTLLSIEWFLRKYFGGY